MRTVIVGPMAEREQHWHDQPDQPRVDAPLGHHAQVCQRGTRIGRATPKRAKKQPSTAIARRPLPGARLGIHVSSADDWVLWDRLGHFFSSNPRGWGRQKGPDLFQLFTVDRRQN